DARRREVSFSVSIDSERRRHRRVDITTLEASADRGTRLGQHSSSRRAQPRRHRRREYASLSVAARDEDNTLFSTWPSLGDIAAETLNHVVSQAKTNTRVPISAQSQANFASL